jgi:ketosteroid isomerase-like protein
MAAKALKEELMALENKFWQAMQDKDVKTALSMTLDPCIVAGPAGASTVDKQKFEQMMKGAKWTLHEFDIQDAQVQQLSDDVAIVAYKVRERLTVDDKPVELEAADASTWVKKGGRWLCALHTESLKGDPYGRDRKAAAH